MRILLAIVVCFSAAISFAQPPVIKKVSAKEVKAIIDSSTGPLIINFWASYCGPCIREIPYFETKVEQSSMPVKLILVSLDLPQLYPQKFKAFLKSKAYKSEVVVLKETDYDYFEIDKKWTGTIPASIFVDNSKKYYRLFTTQLTEQKLDLELKNMLSYAALPVSSQ